MGYGYAYGYGLASAQNPAQLYAAEQAALYVARVTADGGMVQNRFAVEGIYRLLYEQGLTTVRRYYTALGGVKLNDLGGGNFGVQTWYDLNNTAPVDAIQTTAASQPVWTFDATIGRSVPLFDGSNDFMSVNDLGIFNAQSAGTLVAVAKDLNRTGGDSSHNLVTLIGGGVTRMVLGTRSTSNRFVAAGRRLDTDSIVIAEVTPSLDNYNYITGLFVWGGNSLICGVNSINSATVNFSSGAGITTASNATLFDIGSQGGTTNRLNGYITDIIADRAVYTTAQLSALRNFYKQYNSQLP